jgi:hypothetical protein
MMLPNSTCKPNNNHNNNRIDESRYFVNLRCSNCSTTSHENHDNNNTDDATTTKKSRMTRSLVGDLPNNNNSNDDVDWGNIQTCYDVIHDLLNRCCYNNNKKGNDGTNERGGSCNNSQKQNHLPGTLYCGNLGNKVYLQYRMGQWVKKHSNSLVSSWNQRSKNEHNSPPPILHPPEFYFQRAWDELMIMMDHQHNPNTKRQQRVTLLESSWVGMTVMKIVLQQHIVLSPTAAQKAITTRNHREIIDHEVQQFILQLSELVNRTLSYSENEVLYGKSGAIQAILFLRYELQDPTIGQSIVVSWCKDIILSGLHTSATIHQLQHDRNCSDTSQKQSSSSLPLLWE